MRLVGLSSDLYSLPHPHPLSLALLDDTLRPILLVHLLRQPIVVHGEKRDGKNRTTSDQCVTWNGGDALLPVAWLGRLWPAEDRRVLQRAHGYLD